MELALVDPRPSLICVTWVTMGTADKANSANLYYFYEGLTNDVRPFFPKGEGQRDEN